MACAVCYIFTLQPQNYILMFQMTYSVVSGYEQFAIDKSQTALSNKNTN